MIFSYTGMYIVCTNVTHFCSVVTLSEFYEVNSGAKIKKLVFIFVPYPLNFH